MYFNIKIIKFILKIMFYVNFFKFSIIILYVV